MNAIYNDRIYNVVDVAGDITLAGNSGEPFDVSFGSPGLIVEPTDDEVAGAVNLAEWYGIDDYPWQTPAEIHGFVHDEAHDSGCEDIVLHVRVPRQPEAFKVVERHVILCDLVELTPVCSLDGSWEAAIMGCDC